MISGGMEVTSDIRQFLSYKCVYYCMTSFKAQSICKNGDKNIMLVLALCKKLQTSITLFS